MKLSIILPAFNEAESIGQVLAEVRSALSAMSASADTGLAAIDTHTEILVVDGGSRDGTPELAAAAGAMVIHEPRRGYGQACHSGLQTACGEVVVFLDADGADDPARLPALLQPVLSGQADLVLGSRLAGRMMPGSMPLHQRLGNWLCAAFIRQRCGLPLTDLSPFRAARRAPLLALSLREMTFGYPTEMITAAARAGWRITEVPVGYRRRIGGRSKISGTLRGTLLATYYILKIIARG
jgi:glycosyltransferase involved in cell wall biosynthesis